MTEAAALEKFSLAEAAAASRYYAEHGYVVFSRLLPQAPIDRFLSEYARTKGKWWFVFPTQSTQQAVPFIADAYGHIPESMENPAFMALQPAFIRAGRNCVMHENVARGLAAIDGHGEHVIWQSMFFDKSTGTPPHQDSWYLDTEPRGKLVGAWIALEDISAPAGPFQLYPGTQRLPTLTQREIARGTDFVREVERIIAERGLSPLEMEVAKGDVIFWHPSLFHGSAPNRDPTFSRKSFTAHFYPLGARTTDAPDRDLPDRAVSPAFAERKRSHAVYHARQYLRWMRRIVLGEKLRAD